MWHLKRRRRDLGLKCRVSSNQVLLALLVYVFRLISNVFAFTTFFQHVVSAMMAIPQMINRQLEEFEDLVGELTATQAILRQKEDEITRLQTLMSVTKEEFSVIKYQTEALAKSNQDLLFQCRNLEADNKLLREKVRFRFFLSNEVVYFYSRHFSFLV